MDNKKSLCIVCGADEQGRLAQDSDRPFWLREDAAIGLGICYECGEFVSSWDEGVRDVRHFKESLENDASGTLIQHLVSDAKLPTFPHVLLEIYKELDSNVAGVERIVPLLESDPGLTARTLRLGNSAYYARSQQYTQVKDVVMRVGPFDLWSLLVATEVKNIFYGISAKQMDMALFWKHSLYTACACRRISEDLDVGQPGDLFIAGLLHDLGKLLLLRSMPIEYGEVLDRQAAGETGWQVELDVLGVGHAQVGAELFRSWNFPELLVVLTQDHHANINIEIDSHRVLLSANQLAHHHLDEQADGEAELPVSESLYENSTKLYQTLSELVL